jgi:DNA-binding NarL/FixJ family response regulator
MDDPVDTRLRVLVVDDSEDYVEAVCRLLATYQCVGAVDQALDSAEALARTKLNRPDLMLVDVAMPGVNGFELTRAVKAMPSPARVIIVTLYDTPTYREAAKAAGADGFLGKSQLGEGLHRAIERIFPEVCAGVGRR